LQEFFKVLIRHFLVYAVLQSGQTIPFVELVLQILLLKLLLLKGG
jgi:hypothetical protein